MKAIPWVDRVMIAAMGVLLSAYPAQGQAMTGHVHAKAALSTSLTLSVEGRAATLTVAELRAMPQKTVIVHNGHTNTHEGDVIVATSVNGKDLGDDGEIKLVASGDKNPMRWGSNLAKITLVTVN